MLCELLAARRAFTAPTMAEAIAAVLMTDPDWHALPSDAPNAVRDLLRRCLDRDPQRCVQDLNEILSALDRAGKEGPATDRTRPAFCENWTRQQHADATCRAYGRPQSTPRWATAIARSDVSRGAQARCCWLLRSGRLDARFDALRNFPRFTALLEVAIRYSGPTTGRPGPSHGWW